MKELEKTVREMKEHMPANVVAAHEHSSLHRAEVLSSEMCGCFYCGGSFLPTEILEWVDNGKTALCPECGIDAVLGSSSGIPLTKEFMDEMNRHWF